MKLTRQHSNSIFSPYFSEDNNIFLFILSYLGIAGLYVQDQMLAGFEAGSVTISCHYHLPRKTDIKWCKLAGKCVSEPRGLLDGASVEIMNKNGVVTVSMNRLKKENTGWYWCSVRDLHMPVHITVSTREETTPTRTRTPETTFSQWR